MVKQVFFKNSLIFICIAFLSFISSYSSWGDELEKYNNIRQKYKEYLIDTEDMNDLLNNIYWRQVFFSLAYKTDTEKLLFLDDYICLPWDPCDEKYIRKIFTEYNKCSYLDGEYKTFEMISPQTPFPFSNKETYDVIYFSLIKTLDSINQKNLKIHNPLNLSCSLLFYLSKSEDKKHENIILETAFGSGELIERIINNILKEKPDKNNGSSGVNLKNINSTVKKAVELQKHAIITYIFQSETRSLSAFSDIESHLNDRTLLKSISGYDVTHENCIKETILHCVDEIWRRKKREESLYPEILRYPSDLNYIIRSGFCIEYNFIPYPEYLYNINGEPVEYPLGKGVVREEDKIKYRQGNYWPAGVIPAL